MGSKKKNTPKGRSLSSKSILEKKSKPYACKDECAEIVKHIPVRTEGGVYRRCTLCSTRKDVLHSQWLCQTCSVPLCFQAIGPTYFETFHSKFISEIH
ncbi:hypothetical protein NPIL_33541 [Nephila pilipes]|uniref:PiggyBac transposable element-derived protein 4 C-terminal zinc-ribbon domain-containing protein n=1 Tax=Nephila pilipes TaxID=299642 RepID=A0A8X6QDL2_NEPPI|nr:hypothetical protein NPIL_33541 [Nephila pilipes]